MEITQRPRLHLDWIDSHAHGIVKALQKGGFTTYLVGGCVRDLLLGGHPKDFDIATAAVPQQVKRMIYMSYIIGRRFRLVLVKRDEQQFEVATFRREVDPSEFPEGVPAGDNVFGTPEEDARRRDFTINALFYDPVNEELIDFVDGIKDIQTRVIRMIGDPNVRLVEDSIRILRSLRFAHKLHFAIDPELRAAMQQHAGELAKSVLPRRREEVLKLLRLEDPYRAFTEAYDLGILEHVIPGLHELLKDTTRAELFHHYFEMFAPMAPETVDTVHLFGRLILAMFYAVRETREKTFEGDESPDSITLDDERFQHVMRDELGMFKFEQSAIVKAMEMVPLLTRTEDIRKRGERRQIALLKSEGFSLALQIAILDHHLSGEKTLFWTSLQERLSSQLADMAQDEKEQRRSERRKRRHRPPRRGPGEKTVASDEASENEDPGPQ